MKIRTITHCFNVPLNFTNGHFKKIEKFNKEAKALFKSQDIEIQTLRISTQPINTLFKRPSKELFNYISQLEKYCETHNIDFFSVPTLVDPTKDTPLIESIPSLMKHSPRYFTNIQVATHAQGINLKLIKKCASLVKQLSSVDKNGFTNLRFAVLANCPANVPFFPVSYHSGKPCFSIALEAADLAIKSFNGAKTLDSARTKLITSVKSAANKINNIAIKLEKKYGIKYHGIDLSLAPGPHDNESIARALEILGIEKFGALGTLFLSAFLANTLKSIKTKSIGFSGLMYPLLEDSVMAKRHNKNLFTLESLMLYSTVCGTGLDTIPLPGEIKTGKIASIILDISTLAVVLNKPLTVRLMPVPHKKKGELTHFNFKYLCNSKIMQVKSIANKKLFNKQPHFKFLK